MSGAWHPPADAWATTNVGRFGTQHGIADLDALRARSIDDPAWFWDAVVEFLGIPFTHPVRHGARRHGAASRGPPGSTAAAPTWPTPAATAGPPPPPTPRRSSGRGRRAPPAPGPTPSCAPRPTAWPTSSSSAAWAWATPWASSCRCCPRRSPPSSPSPSSAPCSCPSSPATAPRPCACAWRTPAAVALVTADGFPRRSQAGAHAGDGARRRRPTSPRLTTVVVVDRMGAATTGADDGAGRPVAGTGGRAVRDGRRRQRAHLVPRLHLGHHRATQGRGARPRRVDGEGRRGGRLPDRHRRRRPRVLAHRPRLDHGPLAAHRGAGQRRHPRAVRRCPRPPRARSALGLPRPPPGHPLRHQPHPRPRR